LDADYRAITEVVTLNGTTPVQTSKLFYRINDLITAAGNSAGDITASYDGTVYAKILQGFGRNQSANYTVPLGCAFYLGRIDAFTATANNDTKVMTFRNRITFSDGRVFNVAQTNFLQRMDIARLLPFRVGEKTTIEFQVKISSQTADIGVFGEGVLIQEKGPL